MLDFPDMTAQRLPLLVTKLRPPPVRPEHVLRRRLQERLTDGIHRRRALTLVAAPAGYGKTTLVAGWLAEAELRAAWLGLDSLDNDPVRFLNGLVGAVELAAPETAAAVAPALHGAQQPAPTAVAAALVNELAANDESLVLVLDDYHQITEPVVHNLVEFLLTHRPASMHVILLTRADPPLALSRLRVSGDLVEIRAADLRFTAEEAAAFLRDVLHLPLDEAAIGTLERRTEGWIAGLQLAAVALSGTHSPDTPDSVAAERESQAAFIEDFGGSHRYVIDYLVEEVLRHQGEDVREFLLATAILDRMSAPLCDALLDKPPTAPAADGLLDGEPRGSLAMLLYLDAANLFVIALDGHRTWYRYHQLFAEVLRTNLSPERARLLHRRAADWFAEHRMWPEAIDHALAADRPESAAAWISEAADTFLRSGQLRVLLSWIDRLPASTSRSHAEIATIRAAALLLTGEIDELQEHLDKLDAESGDPVLLGRIRAVEAWVRNAQGTGDIGPPARQALELLMADDALFRILALIPLSNARISGYDLQGAISALREAAQLAEDADQPLAALGALANLAFALLEAGSRREARRLCDAALSRYSDARGQPLPATCIVELPLATAHYIANEIAAAEAYAERGLQGSRELFSAAIMGADAERILARIYARRGDLARALDVLRQTGAEARAQGVTHVAALTEAAAANLELRYGEPAAAEAWATELNILSGAGAMLDFDAVPAYAWATLLPLLIRRQQWTLAESFIRERERRLADGGWRGHLIYTRIIHANLAMAQGDADAALAHLRTTLDVAAGERYISPYLDVADPAVQSLLPHLRQHSPAFIDAVLEAISGLSPALMGREAANEALIEPLTERELEVLDLIAEGLTNRQIAEKLFLSIGTIKRHAYNLYGKLGVGSRTQATARAQELGLLS